MAKSQSVISSPRFVKFGAMVEEATKKFFI
jgi:hypothetical protein